MRILANRIVFLMSTMGMLLADQSDSKWFCNDTQQNGNNEVRNTQICVFWGVQVISYYFVLNKEFRMLVLYKIDKQ